MKFKAIYYFNEKELAGIKAREQEVNRFIAIVAEIHGLPDGCQVSMDGKSIGIMEKVEVPTTPTDIQIFEEKEN